MEDILNWRRVDATITTSGQPSEAQLAALKGAGIEAVINLGPHDNNGALPDEPETLKALGLLYIYIPVDFEAPTDADIAAFCDALDGLGSKPVHVHCIYNARVSAFFYRYALEGRGGDLDEAFARMDSIWRPGGVWASFISKPEDAELPNRYARLDY
ncbi:MAG: protein tyrosine phosphatase family protein [Litoreibacter sp.]|nr:protein tyrosine phosphatase family protein [Litoreibacter sp.]